MLIMVHVYDSNVFTIMCRQSGELMNACKKQEIGPGIFLHQARATQRIAFEAGDTLGLLVRNSVRANLNPLLVDPANVSETGYSLVRQGQTNSFSISALASSTNFLPLISLDIVVCKSLLSSSHLPLLGITWPESFHVHYTHVVIAMNAHMITLYIIIYNIYSGIITI